MKLLIAPVQGHTDAAWRHFHSRHFGTGYTCFTPFIRLERGEFRVKDLKDLHSPLNEGREVIPQVIFRNCEELDLLLKGLQKEGVTKVDLNTGCPFPLQTAKGRGAAFIRNKDEFSRLPDMLRQYDDIEFSLKMRLGMECVDEWREVAGFINAMPLTHVTLHPRVAKQQYGGEPDYDSFRAFLEQSVHPVIYNGDIKTPEDIREVSERFPDIAGIMAGRGILARPSLFEEYEAGENYSKEKRLNGLLRFHADLLHHYESTLCGDSQILSKIKPFWEYSEEEIGRKAWKQIKKASNMAKYHTAVSLVGL